MHSPAVSTSDIPRARGALPLVGHLVTFAKDPLKALERFAAEAGDLYRIKIASHTWWMINRPSEIERVLTASRAFIKDRDLRRASALLGNGLLTSEGDFWRKQRRLAQPAFHKERIAGYAQRMISLTEASAERYVDGSVVDIHASMMALTLQIAAQTLFGDDAVSAGEVGACLDTLLGRFEGSASMVLPEWMMMAFGIRYRRAIRRLDTVIYGLVERRRANPQDHEDLLAMLLAAVDEHGTGMTDTQLRDELVTLLLAGHETTANALTWTWYLLGKHPQIEQRMFEEISTLPEPLGAADVSRLVYTNAILKESMRLFPPAWVLGREAVEDFDVAGATIPRGTQLMLSQWIVHRDPRLWPDPLAFRPERWLDGSTDGLPAYAYFPFGGGQRMCIGKTFASMETALLLATLARRFVFSPIHQSIRLRASITLRPQGGLSMLVRRRAASRSPSLRSGLKEAHGHPKRSRQNESPLP